MGEKVVDFSPTSSFIVMNDTLQQAAGLLRDGTPFAIATVVRAERPTSAKPGAKAIITADGRLEGWVGGSCAQPTVIREAVAALKDGQPRFLRLCPPEHLGHAPQAGVIEVALTCISGGTLEVYIEPHRPRPLLVAIGHLPVVEALATLAAGLHYTVAVLGLDASPERFPHASLVVNRLDYAQLPPAAQTYVVVASHGNYDEEALEWALGTDAAYVALVASPERGESVRQYLAESGLSADRLSRLKCPAGLNLGADGPGGDRAQHPGRDRPAPAPGGAGPHRRGSPRAPGRRRGHRPGLRHDRRDRHRPLEPRPRRPDLLFLRARLQAVLRQGAREIPRASLAQPPLRTIAPRAWIVSRPGARVTRPPQTPDASTTLSNPSLRARHHRVTSTVAKFRSVA